MPRETWPQTWRDSEDARQKGAAGKESSVRYPKKTVQTVLACGLAASLSAAPLPAQQQGAPARPASDIVSDNLDRVAAEANQILEVLNKDSGLLVEFKRLLAEDAGASGQILEESDLSDGAISDRVRRDLRTRVLATRLLRRYGYLVPKLNPDSELAAEHNLALRARAQEIDRTSESHDPARAAPQTVITVGAQPSAERPVNQGRPARPPLAGVDGAMDNSRPEILTAPPEVHMDLVKAGARESLQSEPVERTSRDMPIETLMPGADMPSAPASRPSSAASNGSATATRSRCFRGLSGSPTTGA